MAQVRDAAQGGEVIEQVDNLLSLAPVVRQLRLQPVQPVAGLFAANDLMRGKKHLADQRAGEAVAGEQAAANLTCGFESRLVGASIGQ